ncbi:MAG: preprotein translocase subunit SecY [bacterium]|nr:preprotein translocase subunit SecY [bacterium]
MGFIDALAELGKLFPSVEPPKFRPPLKQRLLLTFFIGVLYLVLTHVPLIGVSKVTLTRFQLFQAIIASSFGTLVTLGISPIVTASIIMSLLVGSKIVELDLEKEEDRKKFQNAQRSLAYLLCIVEAALFVLGGAIQPVRSLPLPLVDLALIVQAALGAALLILLDEIVTLYGFGSGISLFIFAGVVQSMFVGLFNPLILPQTGMPAGYIPRFIYFLEQGELGFHALAISLLPAIFTIIILLVSLYLWMIKIEIPVTHVSLRGYGARFPIMLLYTNVIPVIFAFALLYNIQLLAMALHVPALAQVENGRLVGGLVYYLLPPNGLEGYFYNPQAWSLRVLGFSIYIIITCILFSYFWVYAAGMDSEALAEQISEIGFQLSGFRRDKRVLKNILDRYIPYVTFLSAVFTAAIIILAQIVGSAGSGTGLFLAAGIAYNFYELLKQEKGLEMLGFLRSFLEA